MFVLLRALFFAFSCSQVLTFVLSPAKPQSLRFCGASTTDEEVDGAEKLVNSLVAARDVVQPRFVNLTAQPVIIDIYFHVITSGKGIDEGDVLDSQFNLQMKVLNQYFLGTGFQFVHKGTSRVINADWFDNVDAKNFHEREMKNSLKEGKRDPKILNVYTVGFTNIADLYGYATFPWNFRGRPITDGIVMLYSAIAGGKNIYNRDSGLLLVHEVGHWAGLLHTFYGGCIGRGDRVTDTPNEAQGVTSCERRKSCPGNHTSDLIDNPMSYSPEGCLRGFTPGQTRRMKRFLHYFRGIG